jgi:hypothetical protein
VKSQPAVAVVPTAHLYRFTPLPADPKERDRLFWAKLAALRKAAGKGER